MPLIKTMIVIVIVGLLNGFYYDRIIKIQSRLPSIQYGLLDRPIVGRSLSHSSIQYYKAISRMATEKSQARGVMLSRLNHTIQLLQHNGYQPFWIVF